MSEWRIQIPFRDRSDPLIDVVDASRELSTDEDRAVVRQLVLGEITGGSAATVGELLDKLEKAAPAERRQLLDAARVKAGLPDTGTVEARKRVRQASHLASIKAGSDHRPWRLAYTDTGGIVDLNERDDDIARERAKQESLRLIREDQAAVRAVEAAGVREHEEARDAAFRSELPPGFPG